MRTCTKSINLLFRGRDLGTRLAYGNTSSSSLPSPPLPPNPLSPDRELEEALRTGQSDIAELREEFTHRIASLEKKLQTVIKVCVCKHTVFMQECNLCNCVLMSVTASVWWITCRDANTAEDAVPIL